MTDRDATIEAIATAWMRFVGFSDEQIIAAEAQSCSDTCERDGDAWDCTDENGDSRHPIADELAAACAMANVATEAMETLGWHPPARPIGYAALMTLPTTGAERLTNRAPMTREQAQADVDWYRRSVDARVVELHEDRDGHLPASMLDTVAVGEWPTRTPIDPTDFGPAHYGIYVYSHEDGWTAYGHHDPRRLVAACIREARTNGYLSDLRDVTTVADLRAAISQEWAVKVEDPEDPELLFKLADADAPDAFPVTLVEL